MGTPLPPGPGSSAGMTPEEQTFRWFANPYGFLRECARRHGAVFTVEFTGQGAHVFFREPDAVHAIFTGDGDHLLAGEGNAVLRPFLGSGSLLLLDGECYRRERKRILPAFTPVRVRASAERIAGTADAAVGAWREGDTVALDAALRAISLDVILRLLFGEADEGRPAVRHALLALLEAVSFGSAGVAAAGAASPVWARYQARMAEIETWLGAEIEARRRRPGDDILSLLLEPTPEGGAPESRAVRDELVTLVIAGHETVATALAWVFARLLAAPQVAARLGAELSPGGALEEWLALPYLDAVIREALRIDPVIPVVSRRLAAPATFGAVSLPAGVHVVPCAYLAHRRRETFPRPGAFFPERFLERQFTPYEYFPFGGGTRRCLGMGLALTEMKIIVGTVLSRWELRPTGSTTFRPVRRSVAVAPSPSPRALVRRRRS